MNPAKRPQMILFDYGHTLLCEPGFDSLRGEEALFRYVTRNPRGLTPAQVNAFSQELFARFEVAREHDLELHERQFQRLLYEYLELELSIPLEEAERVFWDNTAPGAPMPHVEEILDCLAARGIRSGVISNLGFSGAALSARIARLLPNHMFEFILASSEYGIRKPEPMLFALALKKAGLNAGEVWFCGDNVKCDVEGAAAVGIFPVWYEDLTMDNPWRDRDAERPTCKHLHIHDWRELVAVLDGLTKAGE